MEDLRKGIALEPTSWFNYQGLGAVYELTGAYDEAIAAYKKAIDLGASSQVETDLAHAYAVSGQTAKARKMLDQLIERSTHTYISPFDVAVVYAGLGDREQAFAWLERAYDEHGRAILGLKVKPRLDPLRADPRFAVLMRRMKVFDAN